MHRPSSYLHARRVENLRLVDLTGASWNRTRAWLTNIAALQQTIVASPATPPPGVP
jgi:hypothetical protein